MNSGIESLNDHEVSKGMTTHLAAFKKIGVVVIGRNEGERLISSLDLILGVFDNLVYVDSDSSDESVHAAKSRGVPVIEINCSQPLSAARARNEGFKFLVSTSSSIEYVQFLDGDCELNLDWLAAAIGILDSHENTAVVCGAIQERFPDKTLYNYLCSREWQTPLGEVRSCGGNSLMRISAFVKETGFREDLIAGEEPELCFRLRLKGWKIRKITGVMVIHDADMSRFTQWWKRSARGGYAFAQGMSIHGSQPERYNVRESMRIWIWGALIPLITIFLTICFGSEFLMLLLIYPIQVARLAVKPDGLSRGNIIFGFFLVVRKFPEVLGQIKFIYNRANRTDARLMEYK